MPGEIRLGHRPDRRHVETVDLDLGGVAAEVVFAGMFGVELLDDRLVLSEGLGGAARMRMARTGSG